ncbi:MAG: sigma-70 family RNA polymerase sigma factor, partial [Gemmatimonadetes bacterium]|nr:sigma-70 family RNA polymerase sigma factor [Gemmatimonadota bacterium]
MYRFARSLTGAESEAEDLAQDTYLQAYRNWRQFQPGTNCRAWHFTICRNLRIRAWRRAREEPTDTAELESLASAGLHSAFAETDPSGGFLEAPELDDVLRAELAKLPEEYREVVVLADVEDQSYRTIAQVLD